MDKMYCSKCGCENDDNDLYCSNCGEKLRNVEEYDCENEDKVNKGIKGSTLLKIIAIIFVVIISILLFFLSNKNSDNREEIYSFYITNENEDVLMEGKIKEAKLEKNVSEKPNEEEYFIKVGLTEDGAVIFENITHTNMNEIINIYLDDNLLLSSVVNEVVSSGQFYIPVHDEKQGEELIYKLNNTKQ